MGTETGVVLTIPGHGGKPLTLARTTSRISYDCSFGAGFDPFLLMVDQRRDQVLKARLIKTRLIFVRLFFLSCGDSVKQVNDTMREQLTRMCCCS